MNSKAKEPLFHIVKRDALPWQRGLRIRLLAILLALVVCGILTTIFTGINPVQVYVSIFMGAFGTARKTWITFQNVAILLLISLALTPAFRMRFWNIGGEGQVLIGGLAAAACMICLAGKLPNALVILLMIVTSLAAGAIWGLIPAFFKAKWNTNETLSTLMMNYIATQLVAFFTIVGRCRKVPVRLVSSTRRPTSAAAEPFRFQISSDDHHCGCDDGAPVRLFRLQQARL